MGQAIPLIQATSFSHSQPAHKRLSWGGTLAEQCAAQGMGCDAGQTTALRDGGTHLAGARHPHLAPATR